MSDALIFVLVFAGLFVLRIIAATVVFLWILPRGARCPNCDAVTLRLEARHLNRLIPSLRPSWCMACGWEGMMRTEGTGEGAPVAPPDARVEVRPGAPRR